MEDLIPILTKFHREIVVPDIERIVEASERRIRDEMQTALDGVARELKDLRQEHHMVVAGLQRVEERLDGLEQRLDRVDQHSEKTALRSELLELKVRVDGQEQVRTLEARLEG